MILLGLVIVCVVILLIYLKKKPRKERPLSEIDAKVESYRKETTKFLKQMKQGRSQTKIRRLQVETERFKKAGQLDIILEKAEQERNAKKAIDYYLEAFSFISKNNFELERKSEIED
ncbi:hypothetical protein CEE34_11650, partial [Candidatus Aerophobetes bacterium Ae_b3a]